MLFVGPAGESVRQAERTQRCRIDIADNRQHMIALVVRNCGPSQRSHRAINRVTKITALLQCALHIRDHLVGWQSIITIDWLIVGIVGIVRIIAPRWIPPAIIPTPPSKIEKDDGSAAASPPIAVVTSRSKFSMIAPRFGRAINLAVPVTQLRGSLWIESAFSDVIIVRPFTHLSRGLRGLIRNLMLLRRQAILRRSACPRKNVTVTWTNRNSRAMDRRIRKNSPLISIGHNRMITARGRVITRADVKMRT